MYEIRSWKYNDLMYCISSSSDLQKALTIFSFLFFSFLCSRKVSRATHFSPEHSMVNNLRGAKGQWKWPSILETHHRHPRVCGFTTTTTNRKNLRKKIVIVVAPQKKEERACQAFLFFFPLSLDCRLFYFVYYIENPKKIVSKWWRIVVRPAPNTFCVCSTLYSL